MCIVLANGMAGNTLIEWQDEEYQAFCKALNEVNTRLARQIAADGEGATKLVTCTVKNSRSEEAAERLAKAVVGSNLVKAAMFGADANWGRVLCAILLPRHRSVRVRFCGVRVRSGQRSSLRQGCGSGF